MISVDSRQVYRTLDIGTEKTMQSEMRGIPHHLIDIRGPLESYSAGEFVRDAAALITDITSRGKVPILAGGSHFYFDALLYGLASHVPVHSDLRAALEKDTTAELFEQLQRADPRRASQLDSRNRPRLIRALEVVSSLGSVPERHKERARYVVEWIVIDPEKELLQERIDARLASALQNGLIEEVTRVRALVGDEKLNTFGLEYRVVGDFLRDERTRDSLQSALSAKLWQYARRQKAWLRKLREEYPTEEAVRRPGKS